MLISSLPERRNCCSNYTSCKNYWTTRHRIFRIQASPICSKAMWQPYLIGVVRARNQQEKPRERVLGRIWDLPGLGTCRETICFKDVSHIPLPNDVIYLWYICGIFVMVSEFLSGTNRLKEGTILLLRLHTCCHQHLPPYSWRFLQMSLQEYLHSNCVYHKKLSDVGHRTLKHYTEALELNQVWHLLRNLSWILQKLISNHRIRSLEEDDHGGRWSWTRSIRWFR